MLKEEIAACLKEGSRLRENGCIEWVGGPLFKGYGHLRVYSPDSNSYKTSGVHRLAYEIAHGPIPAGLLVCHTCDNRTCINPDHLFAGTNKDNMHDKVKKQRQARGERHGCAKLIPEQVVKIRELFASGIYQKDLAVQFGIDDRTVSAITCRRIWRHV